MLRRRTLWPTRRRLPWPQRPRFRWPVAPSNILIAPTYPTLTLPTDCGCCGPVSGCGFCSPISADLVISVAATGVFATFDGATFSATNSSPGTAEHWTFAYTQNKCGGGLGESITGWLQCATLGGTGGLAFGGNVAGSGFGQVYNGACGNTTYNFDAASHQSFTSFTCSPFYEVLFLDYSSQGGTMTWTITE